MLGAILVKLTFAAAIAATILYTLQHRKASDEILRLARLFYLGSVAGILSVAGLLLYYILTHQFHYYYVWSYSSTDLPLSLLISTLYAGQEGSFLLWALFTGIIGVFLLRYSSKKGYEPELMSIYTAIFTFLILMLVVKNPFKFIWEQFPDHRPARVVAAISERCRLAVSNEETISETRKMNQSNGRGMRI